MSTGPKDRVRSRAKSVAAVAGQKQCLAQGYRSDSFKSMFSSTKTWVALATALLAFTQGLDASVGVREIEFRKVDEFASKGEWLECSLQLEVRRDPSDRERKNPDYIDDLVVSLMLGTRVDRRPNSERQFEFYVAEANLVSLPEGRHTVRFYLPPEVVERDRIGNQVHSYLIRLSRGDRVLLESISRDLERPSVMKSYLSRIDSDAPENKGILQAQPYTPFVLAYPDDTPSFKLRD